MRDRLTLQPLWQDIRYSGRTLRSSPVFSLTVLLAVALSIGPVTAILSVGNWLLWRPHPGVTDARSLAVVWFGQWRQNGASVGFSPSGVSYDNLADIRSRARTITGIAGVHRKQFESLGGGRVAPPEAGTAWSRQISSTSSAYGSAPAEASRPDEDRGPFGSPVVVISHGLAQFSIRISAGRPRQIHRAQQPAVLGHRRGAAGVRRHLEHRRHRGLADRRDLALSEPRQGVPRHVTRRRSLLRVRRAGGTRQHRSPRSRAN